MEMDIPGGDDILGGPPHLARVRVQENRHAGGAALLFEHVSDVPCGAVAEQLAERLFMIRNMVLFDQRQKVLRREPRQGRLAEVRVSRYKVLRPAMQVGEIAAAAAGDEDLLANAIGMFEHRHAPSALAGFDGAHQPRGSGAEHDDIESLDQFLVVARLLLSRRARYQVVAQPCGGEEH